MSEALVRLRSAAFEFNEGEESFRLEIPALDINQGDRLALVGPSGSGKSLCLEILCLLRVCQESEEFSLRLRQGGWLAMHAVDEAAYHAVGLEYRRHQIGILLQSGGLLQSLTARDNVQLPCDISGVHETDIERLFAVLDISSLLNRRIAKMSGGQRQRVALARAIVAKPILLMADEPTSALDPIMAKQAMQLISECADGDFIGASIIVTHEADLAAKCGFEILTLTPLDFGRGSSVPERVRA